MFGAIISPWSYLSLITLAHYLLDREAMPVIFVMNITINRFEINCSMMERGGGGICDLLLKISAFLNH